MLRLCVKELEPVVCVDVNLELCGPVHHERVTALGMILDHTSVVTPESRQHVLHTREATATDVHCFLDRF